MLKLGEILLVVCAACGGLDVVAAETRGVSPASCGNGMVEIGEACDDGNLELGDGCAPSCHVEVQDFFEV